MYAIAARYILTIANILLATHYGKSLAYMMFCLISDLDLVACTNTGYIVSDVCHSGKVYFNNSQHITCYTLWQIPCIYDVLSHFRSGFGGLHEHGLHSK